MARSATDAARVSAIAAALHQACGAIADDHREMLDHQETVQGLSSKLQTSRVSIAKDVAKLAHDDSWTPMEVGAACAIAVKMSNNNDATTKTIGVFISEMKTFAHPKVRATFPVILEACEDAWREEQELLASLEPAERKSAHTPIRKFKSRFYALLTSVARQIKSGEMAASITIEDVVAYCEANDPDHDEDKVAAVLASAIASLDQIHNNFGMEEMKVAADYVRTITAKELMAARKAMLAARGAVVAESSEDGALPEDDGDATEDATGDATGDATTAQPQDELVSGAVDMEEIMDHAHNLMQLAA